MMKKESKGGDDTTAVETGLESEMEKGEQGGEGSVGSNSDGN